MIYNEDIFYESGYGIKEKLKNNEKKGTYVYAKRVDV